LSFLSQFYWSIDCTSSTCRKCSRKHNTLLHIETNDSDRNQISPSVSSTSSHCSYLKAQDVILSTTLVKVFDCNGKPLQLRALLDSGSQSSFITESIADKLKLSFTHINVPVTGINESISTAKKLVELKIHSNITAFSATLTCLVSKKITERLPIVSINLSNFTVLCRPKNFGRHCLSIQKKNCNPYFIVIMITVLIMNVIFWVVNFKTQNYFVISTTQNVYLRLSMYGCPNFVHSYRIFGISELQTV
jgi:hypothetical protein